MITAASLAVEQFIEQDIKVSTARHVLGLRESAPLAMRLPFAFSKHVLTQPVLAACGRTTRIELTYTHAHERFGFASLAQRADPPSGDEE